MEEKFKKQIVNALIHFLYTYFVYFIFIVPFELWKKATIRMSEQRANKSLSISKMTSDWPFLSFLKRFILDFLIDGLIFMSYILAIFVGVAAWLVSGEILALPAAIVYLFFTPLWLSLVRDIIQLLILPFKKFLSWVSKPAQYMDLEIKNK